MRIGMTRFGLTLVAAATATAAALVSAAACKGDAARPPGPAYTPSVANWLKAIAPDCQVRPSTADANRGGENRTCRGAQSTVTLEIDRARNLRSIELEINAIAGTGEVWGMLEPILPNVVGAPSTEVARKKLRGEPAVDVAGGPAVFASVADKRHRLAFTW